MGGNDLGGPPVAGVEVDRHGLIGAVDDRGRLILDALALALTWALEVIAAGLRGPVVLNGEGKSDTDPS